MTLHPKPAEAPHCSECVTSPRRLGCEHESACLTVAERAKWWRMSCAACAIYDEPCPRGVFRSKGGERVNVYMLRSMMRYLANRDDSRREAALPPLTFRGRLRS